MTDATAHNLAWVQEILEDFWRTAPSNSLHLPGDEKAWEMPRLAVARGDDPWFARLKEMIGPFYWTPAEAFALAFPEAPAAPAELSVLSYVLPQTAATRRDQAQERELPAERWARSRFFGEQFNCDLRLHLAANLSAAGYPAVAPERLPGFDYRQSEGFGLASNWSERHTAFVAGLGTFGLSDGLITPWGKAVRFGSVVTKLALPASARPYGEDHQAWCLWHARGTCGVCARRCPVDAITTAAGHDKKSCHAYIREVTTPYTTKTFGTGATPCGLCQVRIPCEARVPL
ncbi:4Fe-4S ferredoxin [Geoalkalibacter sp.]|uniref:4Fe-4S ferredoxin n=1 Tax=Geoalkalibacter sp. TaxID=3041440 RepID=UPI00272E0DE0|nr:4Fe-4S ferredoxin [Geoalkalibacter sp.]